MKTYLKILFGTLWAVLFAFGAIAFYERLTSGDVLTNLTSYVPWGLWVASYIYFIGLSAGAFLLSSLAYGLGQKKLEPIGKYALFTALATLFVALLTIWTDIGHMPRAIEIFTRPQFNSLMAWMVWLYTGYFILLLAELFFAFRVDLGRWNNTTSSFKKAFSKILSKGGRELPPDVLKRDRKVLQTLALIGIPVAVAFHGGVGALFGSVAAQEIWHSPFYPILFLAGAIVSGGALLTALFAFFWPTKDAQWRDITVYLGRLMLGLILVYAVFDFAEYSIPLWYGVGDAREIQAFRAILFGQYWYVFWVFQIALGLVASSVILWLAPKQPKLIGFATGLFATTFFAVRLNIVIPAYVEPQLQGLQTAYIDSRLVFSYVPSLFEWQVLLFVVMVGVAILYFGYRYLPLTDVGGEREEKISQGQEIERQVALSPEIAAKDFQQRVEIQSRLDRKVRGENVVAMSETKGTQTEKEPSALVASEILKRRRFLAFLGTMGVSLFLLGLLTRVPGYGKMASKNISAAPSKDIAVLNTLKQQYSGEANVSLVNTLANQGLSRESANQLTNQQLLEASVPSGQKLVTTQLVLGSSSQAPSLQLPVNSAIEDPYARMQADLQRALAKPIGQRRWGMVIDQRKCIGCSSCTVACIAENHLPPGVVYRPVIVKEVGSYPNVSMQFTPRPCMQCDNPPCVPVCPVGATFKRADGIVVIDYDACIGCRYCITACPYQARTFDWGLYYTSNTPKLEPYETAPSFEYNKNWSREGMNSPIDNTRKCHFCIQRLDAGILPACVTTCLGRATYFGDLNDPHSLISELVALPNATRLKEDLGTEPKVYYLV